MTKAQLVAKLAEGTGASRKHIDEILASMIDTVVKTVKKGESVKIPGLRIFRLRKMKARTGRNPQIGQPIQIPARENVGFSIDKSIKEIVLGDIQTSGYKLSTTKIVSSYDWVNAPVACGPCELVGDLPTYDLKGKALPLRFLEGAFYEYPRGFVAAWGKGLRVLSPEALLGNAFKLRPQGGGFFTDWHGLGTPKVEATLEPAG